MASLYSGLKIDAPDWIWFSCFPFGIPLALSVSLLKEVVALNGRDSIFFGWEEYCNGVASLAIVNKANQQVCPTGFGAFVT
jgi:hypothetical protein